MYISSIPDQKAWAVKCFIRYFLILEWNLQLHLLPFSSCSQDSLHKIQLIGCMTIIIATAYQRQTGFLNLLLLVFFGKSASSSIESGHSPAIQGKEATSEDRKPASAHLVATRASLRQNVKTTKLIPGAVRQSTGAVLTYLSVCVCQANLIRTESLLNSWKSISRTFFYQNRTISLSYDFGNDEIFNIVDIVP